MKTFESDSYMPISRVLRHNRRSARAVMRLGELMLEPAQPGPTALRMASTIQVGNAAPTEQAVRQ